MPLSADAEWWRPDFEVADDARADTLADAQPGPPGGTVSFWALMGFTGILLVAPQTVFPVLAPFRIALVAAGVATAACLGEWLLHGRPLIRPTRETWLAGCLVGWAILTLPLSDWVGGSVGVLFDRYFKALAVFWLLSVTVSSLRRLWLIAWGLSVMAVPLAATAVGHFVAGQGQLGRIVGYRGSLMENPNDLALMLNLVLPVSVAVLLITQTPIVRAMLVGIILLDVTAVIVTFSRAGFLTLATTGVLYQWKLRKRPERTWALVALVLVVLALPLLPSGYLDRLSTVTDLATDRTGSAQERWNGMVTAVRLVLDRPIVGAGVGMNIVALTRSGGPAWRQVHNVYLEYAVDLGLPGLLLFVWLLVRCIKSTTLVRRRAALLPASRSLSSLAEGIQVSLVAFAVAGFFHPVAYHFYFYYFAGLAVAAQAVYETEASVVPVDPEPPVPS